MKSISTVLGTAVFLSSLSAQAAIDTANYRYQAYFDNALYNRCVSKPSELSARQRIDWARNEGIITANAADWGKQFKYYPVIDYYDKSIFSICSYEVTPSSAATLEKFKLLAERSDMGGRCLYRPDPNPLYERIDWAILNGKISNNAGLWGRYNGYYPIIDFFAEQLVAVCPFGR
ncbi:hypothetical protein [Pseudoalteromonas sp. Of7M-16]|uniref:hypothetical protein n=1 Tax=Pseudoalteromonas sp. Of7M-16 TaxID=2917756 RepID=UPI001EF40A36|nr:hypothetical protein [Pseudoalteromonas sp. Of7M-16]MCG7547556.1 hypothetical protein [Pseudoalteromonas sp. Of7M-16]